MVKKHTFWIPPLMVAVLISAVYAVYGLFPIGANTIAWCDMKQQVIPILMDLKDILAGNTSMMLNLQNAGGMSFWGVFLFFASSPFSFLVAFVEKTAIYQLVNVLLILKMMVCSETAYLFFIKKFPTIGLLPSIALSMMYAFCGYTMFYFQNIVWLDMMYLFPLLVLSLDRLIIKQKILSLTVVLMACITVNFYLSYMVFLFLVFASGTYLLLCSPNNERRKSVLLLGFSVFSALTATAVVWLPSFLQYLESARTDSLIASLRSGYFLTATDLTMCMFMFSGAILAAFLAALLKKMYRDRQILWNMTMLFLLFLPLLFDPINKMWHTGSYQSFPARYGYMTVFLGLMLFASVISKLYKENRVSVSSRPQWAAVAVLFIAVAALTGYLLIQNEYSVISIYTNTLWENDESCEFLMLFAAMAVVSYFVLIVLVMKKCIGKTAFGILLCVLTVVEGGFYSSVFVGSASNSIVPYSYIIDLSGKIEDGSLFRVKVLKKDFDVNLVGGMGYNSLSHYTSLTSKDYMYTLKKFGYSSYWMEVNSNGGTKLTDAVLGNKYTIEHTYDSGDQDNFVYSNDSYAIEQNEISLPIGFVFSPDDISSLSSVPQGLTRSQVQQYLFDSLFPGNGQLITDYQPESCVNVDITQDDSWHFHLPDSLEEGTISYEIPVTGTQTLYFDCFDKISNALSEHIYSSFSVRVNGMTLESKYPSQKDNGLVNLGTYTNETVKVTVGVLNDVYANSFGVFSLNDDLLKSAVDKTQAASLKQSGSTISGTAQADGNNEYLFLPISDDENFSVTVNGKKAELFRAFDTFMAVKLENGSNAISITGRPKGLWTGMAVSFAGIAFLIFLHLFLKRGNYCKLRFLETAAGVVFAFLCVILFFAVYLFPVIVYLL